MELPTEYFELKMPSFIIILLTLIAIFVAYCYYYYYYKINKQAPPGSFGFPVIGESISFAKAQKQDKTHEWIQKRVKKYGPVFKTSLFGSNVVVVIGQVGNRFVFSGGDNGFSSQQPKAIVRILGRFSLFELSGSLHKLVRGAVAGCLKPESIQRYVTQMDSLIQDHLLKELKGKDSVEIVKLMKKISFYVACTIFFGITDETEREILLQDFTTMLTGIWAIPLNIPGTVIHRALKAKARVHARLSKVIEIRKMQMEQETDQQEDIVRSLLNLRDENGKPLEEELIINVFLSLILASHDTTSSLMTFLLRQLSKDDQLHTKVLAEQMEVVKDKLGGSSNEALNWGEIKKMKYTWSVAQEILRINPPIFGTFRLTTRDISFNGFHIPKGWQLLWVASTTHMDTNIFEDPYKFDPSRFDTNSAYPPLTYIPFGAGPRMCPGAEFARIESILLVHHFITKYQWKETIPNEPISRWPTPYPAMGLPVKLQHRNAET
ncbi:beta-amyrin 28-monooxygenase-like [Mercurialis annua]|uniref:beta-amyrin 28-monooxygenase-like n=1 Tax=Mercurialis annua TaxID=3986 RepID=UPI00215E00C4|nr:beta-amyrin 28-monooxygenase-like [Mercurialis annua]